MEIKIFEKTKKRAVFEAAGTDATLCNAIRKELWNIKGVKTAGYHISHPLVGVPRFTIETDGKTEPLKAFSDATGKVKKNFEKLSKQIKSIK